MVGTPEWGILGLTEYLFMNFFRPKNQEYRSRKEKQKTYRCYHFYELGV